MESLILNELFEEDITGINILEWILLECNNIKIAVNETVEDVHFCLCQNFIFGCSVLQSYLSYDTLNDLHSIVTNALHF